MNERKGRYKHRCCYVQEGDVWKRYSAHDLKHDLLYEKLHKNPNKFIAPNTKSPRLKIVEREEKKRHFAVISEGLFFNSGRFIDAADQEIHTARIDYLLEKLSLVRSIRTISNFSSKDDVNSWKILDNLDGMEWWKEPTVTPYNISPDLFGHFPDGTVEKKFKANKSSLSHVLIETICKGPPDQKKMAKLLEMSRNEPVLIIFDILTHPNPNQSNFFMRIYEHSLILRCSYYVWRGMVYKNGIPIPELNDFRALKGEIRSLQKRKGFLEGIE